MENFENRPHNANNVKEKDVYFLQLNTPRIIIMSSALLGIIVASFLFGMNFIRDDDKTGNVVANDIFLNENKDLDIFERNIPAPPDSDNISAAIEDEKKTDIAILGNEGSNIGDKIKKTNILTSENIETIAPPVITERKVTVQATERKPEALEKPVQTVSKVKKSKKKIIAKKTKKKSKVVEVVARKKRVKASPKRHPGFSIQIASYDSKSKANAEIKKLKELDLNAYVTSKKVNGKRYHRVRVGPKKSKEQIMDLLSDIQEMERYEASYIIKE